MKGKNVWLITWEGTTAEITDDKKIAGVLTARYSDSYIGKLVDFLYSRAIFNVHDMAIYADNPRDREGRFRVLGSYPGHIIWGNNPFLFARRVKDFTVKHNDNEDNEIIHWIEHAIYGNDKENGYKVILMEAEKTVTIIRKTHRPITDEP
jgi:hypothetical protein